MTVSPVIKSRQSAHCVSTNLTISCSQGDIQSGCRNKSTQHALLTAYDVWHEAPAHVSRILCGKEGWQQAEEPVGAAVRADPERRCSQTAQASVMHWVMDSARDADTAMCCRHQHANAATAFNVGAWCYVTVCARV